MFFILFLLFQVDAFAEEPGYKKPLDCYSVAGYGNVFIPGALSSFRMQGDAELHLFAAGVHAGTGKPSDAWNRNMVFGLQGRSSYSAKNNYFFGGGKEDGTFVWSKQSRASRPPVRYWSPGEDVAKAMQPHVELDKLNVCMWCNSKLTPLGDLKVPLITLDGAFNAGAGTDHMPPPGELSLTMGKKTMKTDLSSGQMGNVVYDGKLYLTKGQSEKLLFEMSGKGPENVPKNFPSSTTPNSSVPKVNIPGGGLPPGGPGPLTTAKNYSIGAFRGAGPIVIYEVVQHIPYGPEATGVVLDATIGNAGRAIDSLYESNNWDKSLSIWHHAGVINEHQWGPWVKQVEDFGDSVGDLVLNPRATYYDKTKFSKPPRIGGDSDWGVFFSTFFSNKMDKRPY